MSIGGGLRTVLGKGETWPPWMAGSMGDSGESIEGARGLASDLANWELGAGGSSLDVSWTMEDCRSFIRLSKFEVSDGLRRGAERADGGLDFELAVPVPLDSFEDCDIEGV